AGWAQAPSSRAAASVSFSVFIAGSCSARAARRRGGGAGAADLGGGGETAGQPLQPELGGLLPQRLLGVVVQRLVGRRVLHRARALLHLDDVPAEARAQRRLAVLVLLQRDHRVGEDMVDEQVGPEPAEVALKKNEYSKAPLRTRFGWHVIKVEEGPRPVQNPAPYEALDDNSKQALRQKAAQLRLEGLTSRLAAAAKVSGPGAAAAPARSAR